MESDLGSRVAEGERVLLVHLPLAPSPPGADVLGFPSLLTVLELCPHSPSPCLPAIGRCQIGVDSGTT